MKKKTTLILVVFLLALVGAYFIFVHQWNGPDNVFQITDAHAIGKVEIEKMELNKSIAKLTLQTSDSVGWSVNGQYTANPNKVREFLTTLREIRVLQPVEPKGQATALSLLKRNHLRVHIWDREGNELKDYLIGATNSTQTANIFKMGFSDKCYMVSKPALEGYVSIFYSVVVNDWREKLIWDIKGSDLTAMNVVYAPDSLTQSYSLSKNGSEWKLGESQNVDRNRVGAYLELFEGKVFAESFADEQFPGMMDSLTHRTPEARIHLTTTDKKEVELLLFLRPENSNNFFGYLKGSKELFTVQHFVIDKFLKSGSYFAAATPL